MCFLSASLTLFLLSIPPYLCSATSSAQPGQEGERRPGTPEKKARRNNRKRKWAVTCVWGDWSDGWGGTHFFGRWTREEHLGKKKKRIDLKVCILQKNSTYTFTCLRREKVVFFSVLKCVVQFAFEFWDSWTDFEKKKGKKRAAQSTWWRRRENQQRLSITCCSFNVRKPPADNDGRGGGKDTAGTGGGLTPPCSSGGSSYHRLHH